MGNIVTRISFCLLFCLLVFLAGTETAREVRAEVKPEYMQDVPLDEAHFPGKLFRKKLGLYVDENKDGILSRTEREGIRYMTFSGASGGKTDLWCDDMKYLSGTDDHYWYDKKKSVLELDFNYDEETPNIAGDNQDLVDLTGVEYFFNLEEVADFHHETKRGSFKNNTKLRKIYICATSPRVSKLGTVTYETIREHFPVSRLTYMHLENVIPNTLNVEDIPELEVLRVIFADCDLQGELGCRLPPLDLSKNRKLKEVEFGHILPDRLDLRKNQKVESVKVYGGRFDRGEKYCDHLRRLYYTYYFASYLPKKHQKCRILFAKKNSVKTLHYFTEDKQIDITELSKLKDFQTRKKIKAKVKSDWIRKTFTKKKRKCLFVKDGKVMRDVKAAKKKKFTVI